MKKILTFAVLMLLFISLMACNNTTAYTDYLDTYTGFTPTYGTKVNNETVQDLVTIYGDETATNINVLPVENLSDDFIFGVDVSSILDVEAAGGVFYNADGQEQDVFEILADAGVNYVRIRLWYDPYSDDGVAFGGGTNDTYRGIEIAERAARVGMGIVLDFHYSDFWADPSKQSIPRAWESVYDVSEAADLLYQYTYDTIKAFEDAGVRPQMVQIGNEINNGLVWPLGRSTSYSRVATLVKAGIQAVNDISPDIKTIIHLAQGASEQSLMYFYDKMLAEDVDFDVIGLSYYSYWHGDMATFEETLQALDAKYEQEIAVMEYSYGFTDLSTENSVNIYNSEMETAGGYDTSMQGQASYIRDVNNAVASISKGIGSFYWEPAWLPVAGAGWASEGASAYLEAQGDDTSSLGKVTWANQGLFSYSGKVLPSLSVFEQMRTSTFDSEEILSYEQSLSVVINLGDTYTLPTYTTGKTNLGRMVQIPITWNESDVALLTTPGEYTVNGSFEFDGETIPVTLNVTAYVNYLLNGSFEVGGKVSSDVKDFSLVPNWDVTQSIDGSVKVESKNARTTDNAGYNNINIYATSDYNFTLYQTVTLPAGTYQFSVWARSAMNGTAESPTVSLFASIGDTSLATASISYGASWNEWVQTTITFTITEESTVIVGITGNGVATSWAHFDDFALQIVE